MATISNPMTMSEVVNRAKFLLQRKGTITVDQLKNFCGNPGVTATVAEVALTHAGGTPIGVGIFAYGGVTPQNMMMSQYNQLSQLTYGTVGGGIAGTPQVVTPPASPKKVYKKGDRVEIINSFGLDSVEVGSFGTVISVQAHTTEEPYYYSVQIDGTETSWNFYASHLKPYAKTKVTIDSVVLKDEKKEEIRAAISQQENAKIIFDKWGFGEVFEKGTAVSMLFWGIPGTGKTLMAQAIADEFDSDLKIYSTADIQSMEPGGAERMIRKIFEEATKKNKAKGRHRVILFDECDSLLMDRNEVGPILGAEVNALLTEIERYEGIIIFTTNRLGKLDPALERRLSAKIEFEFPDEAARHAIWQRMIPKQAPLHKDVDLKKLAKHRVAGGNIKNAVLNAARHAAYKKADRITHDHFEQAVKREVASQQAFQDEYKKQTHTTMHGYQRGKNGLTVDRKSDMKQEINISRTISMDGKEKDAD